VTQKTGPRYTVLEEMMRSLVRLLLLDLVEDLGMQTI
jgi:hypothetical protein